MPSSQESEYQVNDTAEFDDAKSYFRRVAIPCAVDFYDEATHTVIVRQLVTDKKFIDEQAIEPEEREPLEGIPVLDWAKIRIIPEEGHHGLLLFMDRNIDEYLETHAQSEEQTDRVHDYNDAVFLPTESAYVGRPEPLITIEGENVTINCDVFTVNANKFVKNGIEQVSINGQGGTPLGGV